MSRNMLRSVPAIVSLSAALVFVGIRVSSQPAAPAFPSTRNGEWTHYTADVKGSKYSPLDQINAANFNKLEVAWRFKTDNLGSSWKGRRWPSAGRCTRPRARDAPWSRSTAGPAS
jgi:hypothetical protein